MNKRHELGDRNLELFRYLFDFVEESKRYRSQSILRPFVEPVNAGAVDESGELTCSNLKFNTDRGETENDLEGSSDSIDEEGPAVFSRVLHSCSFDVVSHARDDFFQFIVSKKAGDFT